MALDRVKKRMMKLRELRDESGKFTKAEAYYAQDAPIQKPIRCGNCVYYSGEDNKCDLVSEEGEPGPGVISRDGTCSLWNSLPARITFIQSLWGRAERQGIAPERVRATAFMGSYAALNETPPQELRDKSFIDFEKVDNVIPGKLEELFI